MARVGPNWRNPNYPELAQIPIRATISTTGKSPTIPYTSPVEIDHLTEMQVIGRKLQVNQWWMQSILPMAMETSRHLPLLVGSAQAQLLYRQHDRLQ
jgi:hypothetical protein